MSRGVRELRSHVDGKPRSAECRRLWVDDGERWRSYLTVDDETAVYCPECAREEFGDS